MSEASGPSLLLVLSTCVVGVAAMSLLAYTLFHLRKLHTQDIPKEKLQQMFIPPKEREMYLKRRAEGAPDDEVKGRLMARAVATVSIKEQHRTESWTAEQLYRRGMLSNDQHNLQKIVTDYINNELREISEDVEELSPGAVQSFWQQAHALHQQRMRNQALAQAQQEQSQGVRQGGPAAATTAAAEPATSAVTGNAAPEEKKQELSEEERQKLADKAAAELLREEDREKAKKRKGKKK